jgi:hypothetical protein
MLYRLNPLHILFVAAGRKNGVQPVPLRIRSPNLNAYAERSIQTLQKECLDHFVAYGTKHLDYLVREFVEHYHAERPHQGLENRAPFGTGPPKDEWFRRGSLRESTRRTAQALLQRSGMKQRNSPPERVNTIFVQGGGEHETPVNALHIHFQDLCIGRLRSPIKLCVRRSFRFEAKQKS